MERYPVEVLGPDDDCGVMPDNVEALRQAVVGQRIVSAEHGVKVIGRWGNDTATIITLDNGKRVRLVDTGDCCAFTALKSFLLHPERVQHAISGVGTTDSYQTWHIFCDAGDVMEMKVGWSAGNPFYYGYGFDITVEDVPDA